MADSVVRGQKKRVHYNVYGQFKGMARLQNEARHDPWNVRSVFACRFFDVALGSGFKKRSIDDDDNMTQNRQQTLVEILESKREDLESILDLQYLAFQSEAEFLNDAAIPPLTETLEDLNRQFRDGIVFLKAVAESGEIVGAVRGELKEDTLCLMKLAVHPDHQGQGIGGRLVAELERRHPRKRYELFTREDNAKTVGLYERMGYVKFREEKVTTNLKFVYLEKLEKRC